MITPETLALAVEALKVRGLKVTYCVFDDVQLVTRLADKATIGRIERPNYVNLFRGLWYAHRWQPYLEPKAGRQLLTLAKRDFLEDLFEELKS